MAFGAGRKEKLMELATSKMDEPVLMAALMTPKGMTGARMGGGLIGQAIHSSSQNVAPGFSAANIVAVAESGLYVFTATDSFGIKIGERLGYWPWGAFGAVTQQGSMVRFLFLYWNDGSVSQLECATMGTTFQGDVCDEIVRRATASSWAPPPPPAGTPLPPPPPPAG